MRIFHFHTVLAKKEFRHAKLLFKFSLHRKRNQTVN